MSAFNASQIYDAAHNTWTSAAAAGCNSCTINLLPNGQVLLAGGYWSFPDTGTVVPTTMLFDPQGGTVRLGAPLALARANHASVVLPDGEVLLAGGDVQRFQYQNVLGQSPLASITDSVESFPWEPSFRGSLDPGYYIATVDQTAWGRGGLWGVEVHSSGQLDGGLNLGGFLDANDVEIGFGGFYIEFPQTVSAVANLQLAIPSRSTGHLPASMRILDAAKKLVAGPVKGDGHLELSQALQPGFYSVELRSDQDLSSPAAFQMALTAPQLTAGGSAGSLISRYAGVSGFVGFYLSTRQDVDITLFNQNTYGFPRGAGEVILELKDSTGKVIFQAGPGVMK